MAYHKARLDSCGSPLKKTEDKLSATVPRPRIPDRRTVEPARAPGSRRQLVPASRNQERRVKWVFPSRSRILSGRIPAIGSAQESSWSSRAGRAALRESPEHTRRAAGPGKDGAPRCRTRRRYDHASWRAASTRGRPRGCRRPPAVPDWRRLVAVGGSLAVLQGRPDERSPDWIQEGRSSSSGFPEGGAQQAIGLERVGGDGRSGGRGARSTELPPTLGMTDHLTDCAPGHLAATAPHRPGNCLGAGRPHRAPSSNTREPPCAIRRRIS